MGDCERVGEMMFEVVFAGPGATCEDDEWL